MPGLNAAVRACRAQLDMSSSKDQVITSQRDTMDDTMNTSCARGRRAPRGHQTTQDCLDDRGVPWRSPRWPDTEAVDVEEASNMGTYTDLVNCDTITDLCLNWYPTRLTLITTPIFRVGGLAGVPGSRGVGSVYYDTLGSRDEKGSSPAACRGAPEASRSGGAQ